MRLWLQLIRFGGVVSESYKSNFMLIVATGFIEGVREKTSPNLVSDWDVFMLNRRLEDIKIG